MTSDEVILRRQRSIDENGYETTGPPPPPRLRGQSTYLALLSSLATDLDIMLNDLRTSPSSRLLPPTNSQTSSTSITTTNVGDGASSAFFRNNQPAQNIPSKSVPTTARTRVGSPSEHRYHHYYYHQQYSSHNQQQQSYCLNQDFYYHRFQNSNLSANGLRSGIAHEPAPAGTVAQSSIATTVPNNAQNINRGALQSFVTTITTSTAATTTCSSHHQTTATSATTSTRATTTQTTLLG